MLLLLLAAQLSEFTSGGEKLPDKYVEVMPQLPPLVTDLKLEPEVAFHLIRPLLRAAIKQGRSARPHPKSSSTTRGSTTCCSCLSCGGKGRVMMGVWCQPALTTTGSPPFPPPRAAVGGCAATSEEGSASPEFVKQWNPFGDRMQQQVLQLLPQEVGGWGGEGLLP